MQDFPEIEGRAFAARALGVERLSTFIGRIKREPAVADLSGRLAIDPNLEMRLLDRSFSLLKNVGDEDYRHPHDVAIAVYLFLLDRVRFDVSALAEATISSPNTWWSDRLATDLMSKRRGMASVDQPAALIVKTQFQGNLMGLASSAPIFLYTLEPRIYDHDAIGAADLTFGARGESRTELMDRPNVTLSSEALAI